MPPSLHSHIHTLPDARAARLLRAAVQGVEGTGGEPPKMPDAVRDASASETATPAGKGEVARAALHVLAETPPHGERIAAMLDAPETRSFDLGSSIALFTAAVVVLQLHVNIERSEDGAWSFQMKKPSASEDLIKTLIDAVQRFEG